MTRWRGLLLANGIELEVSCSDCGELNANLAGCPLQFTKKEKIVNNGQHACH